MIMIRFTFVVFMMSLLLQGCSTTNSLSPADQYGQLKAELEQKVKVLTKSNFIWKHASDKKGNYIQNELTQADSAAEKGLYVEALKLINKALNIANVSLEQMHTQSEAVPTWEQ